MTLKVIKLINGEDIIGQVEEGSETDTSIVITDILRVVEAYNKQTEDVDTYLCRWASCLEKNGATINQQNIIAIGNPRPGFVEFYNKELNKYYPKPEQIQLPMNAKLDGDEVTFNSQEDYENWLKLVSLMPASKLLQ